VSAETIKDATVEKHNREPKEGEYTSERPHSLPQWVWRHANPSCRRG